MNLLTSVLPGLLTGLLLLPPPAAHPAPGQDRDCVRGAAKPVLKKAVYSKARFQLQKDKLTGIETVSFANGDRLIIRNWGCEYYALTFRFETARFRDAATARALWYRHAATLMTELLPGLDAPLDIERGVAALRRAADQGKVRAGVNEEISYGDGNMPEFVAVNKPLKLPGNRYAVEVTFTLGPL